MEKPVIEGSYGTGKKKVKKVSNLFKLLSSLLIEGS